MPRKLVAHRVEGKKRCFTTPRTGKKKEKRWGVKRKGRGARRKGERGCRRPKPKQGTGN